MVKNGFVGYEYLELSVKRSMVSVYADGYANFGWEPEGTEEQPGRQMMDTVHMKFKRDRKICNKMELTRLQHSFDACAAEILSLESSKRLRASVTAYAVGIVGTAFMAESVFAVTAGKIVSSIILAIPAFIGWVLPYFLYKHIEKEKIAELTPMIDQKYDELYAVCEKAHSLLSGVSE